MAKRTMSRAEYLAKVIATARQCAQVARADPSAVGITESGALEIAAQAEADLSRLTDAERAQTLEEYFAELSGKTVKRRHGQNGQKG